MSDLMLQAVLRMPPDLWRDDAWDVKQRHGRYVQAADELEALRAALDQERAKVAKMWGYTEHHERCGARLHNSIECICGLSALLSGRGEGEGNG